MFAEQGSFDIPASWTAGISWEFVSDLTLVADVKGIYYSQVKSIANPMMLNMYNAMTGDTRFLLGTDNGAGFGWEDIMVYKVGLNYAGLDTWEFRCGASFGQNPVPKSEVMFNILAPGVIENQIALGFSKAVGNSGNKIHFAVNYAMNSSVKGANPMDPPSGQTIEIEMNQLELELGFSF
ncbi:MAG: OmpP1/FadL family transporter [Draconibacterium sp.]